jgi:hypothetical protein
MNITGVVENGSIKLPPDVHLPDGTRVTIEVEKSSLTLAERMKPFVGCITDGPPDLAAQHDHYAHGTRKRKIL